MVKKTTLYRRPVNRKAQKINEKEEAKRLILWPDVTDSDLWNGKEKKGFTTIPRPFPYLMTIMDLFSKGAPLSSAYLSLWCRMFEACYVPLSGNEDVLAFEAGLVGQRAKQTWIRKIDKLEELGFIKLAAGPGGERSYALVLDPYAVVKKLQKKHPDIVTDVYWNALRMRSMDIGAKELEED